MPGRAIVAGLVLAVAGGCAHAQAAGPGSGAPPPGARPDEVPAGTLAMVELREPLSTERSRAGDRFTAVLLDPLVDQQGREVAPRGSTLEGRVDAAEDLELRIVALRREEGGPVPFPAEIADAPRQRPSGFRRGMLGALAGAAAGAGAGLIGDARSGAVVGGASVVGAGVGAFVGWLLRGRGSAELPSGSTMTLRIVEPFGAGLARGSAPQIQPGMQRPGEGVQEGERVPAALPEDRPEPSETPEVPEAPEAPEEQD